MENNSHNNGFSTDREHQMSSQQEATQQAAPKAHLVAVEKEVNAILEELRKTKASHTQIKDLENLELALDSLNKNYSRLKKTVAEPKVSTESKTVKKIDASMLKIIQVISKGKFSNNESQFLLNGLKSVIKEFNSHISMVKKSAVTSTEEFKF